MIRVLQLNIYSIHSFMYSFTSFSVVIFERELPLVSLFGLTSLSYYHDDHPETFQTDSIPKAVSKEHLAWQGHFLSSYHICCCHLTCMGLTQFGNIGYNEKHCVPHEAVNWIYSTLKHNSIWEHHNASHNHPLCTSKRDLLVTLDHWVPFQLSLNVLHAHSHLIYSKGQIKL